MASPALSTDSQEWENINESNVSTQSSSKVESTERSSEDHTSPELVEFYDETTSFSDQLSQQGKSVIWSFNFGDQVAQKTRENIQASLRKIGLFENSTEMETSTTATTSQKVTRKPLHETPQGETQLRHGVKRGERGERKRPHESIEMSISTPLPVLPWTDHRKVWENMVNREEATARMRTCRLFEERTSGLARMRAILTDWLMEVCEVYNLRRCTFYLTIDYIDRYLTINPNIPRNKLQLIGITSLFIASKFEEIFPPKLFEFAYVCDGACTEAHILKCEMLLLNSFGWDVNTMTPINWFSLYMQIYTQRQRKENTENISPDFTDIQYSQYDFIRGAFIIDLFSIDPGYLYFNYRNIAASAVYFLYGKASALSVSCLTWEDIEDCVAYMSVFYVVVRDTDDPRLHSVVQANAEDGDSTESSDGSPVRKRQIARVSEKERHLLQTHIVDLYYFERATLLRLEQLGFEVKKFYVKKTKLANGEVEMEDVSDDDGEEDENEQTISMFEIVRGPYDEQIRLAASQNPPIELDETANYFLPNTRYSFDEVQFGIFTFIKKNLLPRRLSRQQVFDD